MPRVRPIKLSTARMMFTAGPLCYYVVYGLGWRLANIAGKRAIWICYNFAMAKKKTTQKKHKFKHVAEPALVASAVASDGQPAVVASAAKPAKAAAVTTTARDFSYVAGDMRRIGISAVVLVAIELVLYYVLTMTSLGTAVYNLVQV